MTDNTPAPDDTAANEAQRQAAGASSTPSAAGAPDPAQLQRDLAAARAAGTAATSALLDQTRANNPTIPPALISGDTPEAIASSVTAARAAVDQVLELNKPAAPGAANTAAAPARAADTPPEGMTGRALIRWALEHKQE